MSTRSLRNRGSSRLASPAITFETEQADDVGGERDGEGDADEWVEPPVRRLPPSYQDHKGLERIGVLELQQPLGEPPSQKLLQRLKLTYNRPSSRATPVQNDELLTPSVESERPEFGSPLEAERLSEEIEDTIAVTSPPRGRPAKRDAEEMRHSGLPVEFTPSPVQSSPRSFQAKLSIQEHLRQDRVSNYMDKAIEEAERNGDLGLLPGLNDARDTAYNKRDLWVVLDAIAHQSPTPEQLSIFKRYIKKGVKRHRKQSARSSNSAQLPFSGHSLQGGEVMEDSCAHASPKGTRLTPTPAFTSPFRPRPRPNSYHSQQHSHPAHPLHLSPSSRPGNMEADIDQPAAQRVSEVAPPGRRSRSNSSTSSLSSAISLSEEFAPAPVGGQRTADERPSLKGKRQGSERQPAKLRSSAISHLNSSHPFHAFPNVATIAAKKLKKTKEDLEVDPVDLDRRRKRFQAESSRHQNIPYAETEVDLREHRPGVDQNSPAETTERSAPPPVVHSQPVMRAQDIVEPSIRPQNQTLSNDSLLNGTSRKRKHHAVYEGDGESDGFLIGIHSPSPELLSPSPPPPPFGVRLSRHGTPGTVKHPAVNKARKSARVMVSPNKPKNGGITAGISRVGPSRESVTGYGADSGAEDNDEFCASCSGEGKLLCCDGCSNSLHHSCLEPPLDPDREVDGEWFCPQCQAKRNKNITDYRGILGKVIGRVQDIIPKAFALPMEVRDYFDGVRTGEGGEYEEFGQARTQPGLKMNRAGFFDEPNYKELRDAKGKLIACYACKKAANGRDLIPCDFCEHRWHLDCLDPPLAVPPRRRVGDKANATWRCPLHLEQDLAGIGRQAEAAPGDLGRNPRPRKPKNGKPIDVSMPRGFKNNGIIEVELIKDDFPVIKEVEMNGGVFRLPEMGIRLDFIDRVKKSWFEDESFQRLAGRPPMMKARAYRATGSRPYHEPDHLIFRMKEPDFLKGSQALAITETAKANAFLRQKSFKEQQAALNLMSLAQATPGYSGDAVGDLINQLVREAPASAELAIQQDEKGTLLHLQRLLQRRLRILDGIEEAPPPLPLTYHAPPPVVAPSTKYKPIQPYPVSQPANQQSSYTPVSNGFSGSQQQNNYNGLLPTQNAPNGAAAQQNNYSPYHQTQSYGPPTPQGNLVQPPTATPPQHLNYPASVPHQTFQPQSQPTPTSAPAPAPSSPQQQQFDMTLDPRLFGNGDFGHDDDGNDADVEMDIDMD